MEKTYLVYKIDTFKGMTLVAECTNIKLCNPYLEKENFRVVTAWRKPQKP